VRNVVFALRDRDDGKRALVMCCHLNRDHYRKVDVTNTLRRLRDFMGMRNCHELLRYFVPEK